MSGYTYPIESVITTRESAESQEQTEEELNLRVNPTPEQAIAVLQGLREAKNEQDDNKGLRQEDV